jgi:hypothetical protein
MNIKEFSKYYDLRYKLRELYVSPVEFKKQILQKEDCIQKNAVDTVQISQEAILKYANRYG